MTLRIDRRSQPLVLRDYTGARTAAVTISGELDVVTAPALRPVLAEVADARPARLLFDLTRVDYIDCASARAIVRAGWSLPAGRRVIIRPSPVVRRILDLTGLSAYCEIAVRHPQDQRGAGAPGQPGEVRAAIAAPAGNPAAMTAPVGARAAAAAPRATGGHDGITAIAGILTPPRRQGAIQF
jgi:anti-anti-sigma factor